MRILPFLVLLSCITVACIPRASAPTPSPTASPTPTNTLPPTPTIQPSGLLLKPDDLEGLNVTPYLSGEGGIDLQPEVTRARLRDWGYLRTFFAIYRQPNLDSSSVGLLEIQSTVDEFQTAEGARSYLSNLEKMYLDLGYTDFKPSGVPPIGDESIGLVFHYSYDPTNSQVEDLAIFARNGAFVLLVAVIGTPGDTSMNTAVNLLTRMQSRVGRPTITVGPGATPTPTYTRGPRATSTPTSTRGPRATPTPTRRIRTPTETVSTDDPLRLFGRKWDATVDRFVNRYDCKIPFLGTGLIQCGSIHVGFSFENNSTDSPVNDIVLYRGYAGRMPYGLYWGQDRCEIREKIGLPQWEIREIGGFGRGSVHYNVRGDPWMEVEMWFALQKGGLEEIHFHSERWTPPAGYPPPRPSADCS